MIAVVAFHVGVPGVGGGFVGVDVFFVVSGFLITRSILGELAGSRHDLAAQLLGPASPPVAPGVNPHRRRHRDVRPADAAAAVVADAGH